MCRCQGQHNRFTAHVPGLPPLPHQVLQGVHTLADARQDPGLPEGAQQGPARTQEC